MIKKVKEIKKELHKVWPKLYHVWFDQPEYYIPTYDEMIDKTNSLSFPVKNLTYKDGIMECESFALFLWSGLKKYLISMNQFNPEKECFNYTWAFGFVRLLNPSHLMLENKSHAMNWCLTQKGVYLIEPQTYEMIKPRKSIKRKDENFIYFLTA